MVYAMQNKNSSEKELLIDLESGNHAPITGFSLNNNSSNNAQNPNILNGDKNGCDLESLENKKRYKKPPKPPRPPKPVSLNLLDQKLVNELTELAMKKKARIERMKALKKMKNSNLKSGSSYGNLCALIVTIIFCLVVLWQGIFSKGTGNLMSFHGSPESSLLGSNNGLVSVQIHNTATPTISPGEFTTLSSSSKNSELELGMKMNAARRSRLVG